MMDRIAEEDRRDEGYKWEKYTLKRKYGFWFFLI